MTLVFVLVDQALAVHLGAYLRSRPHGEVHELLAQLEACQRIAHSASMPWEPSPATQAPPVAPPSADAATAILAAMAGQRPEEHPP